MNQFRLFVAAALSLGLSLSAHSQSSAAAQRQHADSVQRVLMQDSLGLSTSVINQVFAARDSSLLQAAAIQNNTALTQQQQSLQLQTLRRNATEATRELMGVTLYERYLQLLSAQ